MRYAIGVDPGLEGGISMLGLGEELMHCAAMPVRPSERLNRQVIVPVTLASMLNRWCDGIAREFIDVFIENVHSMPGQGVASSFTFGRGFGRVESVFMLGGFKLTYVEPLAWKKHYGLVRAKGDETSKHEMKKRSVVEFKRLYPHIAMKSDGMAESALIARYGQRVIA